MKKRFFYLEDINTVETVETMTKKELISHAEGFKNYTFCEHDEVISGYTKDGKFFYYDCTNFWNFKKSDIVNAISVVYSSESGYYVYGDYTVNMYGVVNPTEDGETLIWTGGNIKEVESADYTESEEETAEEPAADQEPETTEDDTHEETAVNQEVETMNETTTAATVKATTTSILSIWYGNLEAYNNGALRGQWIDFEEMDRDEIEEVMNKISRNGRDECMIFDYESRCGIDVGEYASIDELFEIYEICENIIDQYGDECGEYAIKTFCDYYGAKYLTDIERYDFYFYSECYTMADVAFEVVDQCGYLDEMPENLRGYFDYEKFGRDLDIEGHFNYCGGGVYCEMVG